MRCKICISTAFVLIFLLVWQQPVHAMESANYRLEQSVINSSSNTYTAVGRQIYESVGEAVVIQSYGNLYSVQVGFFNDYFVAKPTPTPTLIPTPTSTIIRTFDGELIHKKYVYAAPNPIRGHKGNIYFDLATSAEVELKIYTPQSQLVLSQHWDSLPAGKNMWVWNTANMANGIYLLRLKARNSDGKTTVVIKKIALIK